MRYKVLISILFSSVLIITCAGVGISSKLDFGESSSKLTGTASHYRSVSTPYHPKVENTNRGGDFTGIGVVCASGDCNKSHSKESKDSIQTDVVVHVKTSVDVNKNQSTFVDDTPDVPVIVGTAGTKVEDSQARSFNQRPFVTNFGDAFSSVGPSLDPSITPSVTSSYIPSYPSYSTPTLQSDNVYVQQHNLPAEPQVDINVKTLPPVTLTLTDDGQSVKDIRYKTNGIELRVPYFEPSYHNHYFGESPPPQFAYYPKRPAVSSPVDYKPRAQWKPSIWSVGNPHRHIQGKEDTCPCKNQPATGLQWYPNRGRYDDPGSKIDDKLAPLN